MKKTSTTAPSLVETAYNSFRQKVHTINFDIVLPKEEGGEYEYESLEVPPGQFNYGGLVSLLVRHKYTDDMMAAVQNNFLATYGMEYTEEGQAHQLEFAEMQAWRETAKALAHRFLEEVQE